MALVPAAWTIVTAAVAVAAEEVLTVEVVIDPNIQNNLLGCVIYLWLLFKVTKLPEEAVDLVEASDPVARNTKKKFLFRLC